MVEGMNVAVAHDRLENVGGGELDAKILAEMFDADIFVGRYKPEKTYPEFKEMNLTEVNRLLETPPTEKSYALVRMFDTLGFMGTELNPGYDVAICTGMWSPFVSIRNDIKTIWYCLSPNRGIYDLKERILDRMCWWQKPTYEIWSRYWRACDKNMAKEVDVIVSQSETVSERIRRYYNREPDRLIYPPVDVKRFRNEEPEDFWFLPTRIMKEKRLHDVVLPAFERLPREKLVVCGGSPNYYPKWERSLIDRMESMKNVEYKGRVDDDELIGLYSRCKGTIQASVEEDLGLVPIESIASGKPCLAVREGGFKETIDDGRTGILIDSPYVENLEEAVRSFDGGNFEAEDLMAEARKYSLERFRREWRSLIREYVR